MFIRVKRVSSVRNVIRSIKLRNMYIYTININMVKLIKCTNATFVIKHMFNLGAYIFTRKLTLVENMNVWHVRKYLILKIS